MSGAVGAEVEVTASLLRPLHAVRSGRLLTYLPMYYDVPTYLHSDQRPLPLLLGDDYLERKLIFNGFTCLFIKPFIVQFVNLDCLFGSRR